jgi:hypothetical protein
MNDYGILKQPILKYSLIAEAIGILIATFAAGAGHGSYAPARIIFPYTMISTVFHENIRGIYLIFGLIQFPIYGLVIASASNTKYIKQIIIILTILHFVAVYYVFTNHNQYFPNIP